MLKAMFEKDDFIFQLLKYGANDLSVGINGLTYNELKSNLQDLGYKIETMEEHQKIWQVIRESFVYPEGIGGNKKYYLSLDSFFNLLDYLELNELENH
jgi:hypothetical protein